MHPRNPFRVPPDFKELSKAYTPLEEHIVQSQKGPTINFQDREAQRRLTEALLYKYFNLSLSLPKNRLCPPVPNRLNYILWLEDLLNASSLASERRQRIRGIDIGTGASAIYPLLGCRTNVNWSFTATDIDDLSLKYAQMNINNNNLSDRIALVKLDATGPILPFGTKEDVFYDFTMCNPPFYSDREEALRSAEAKELGPYAVCTGADVEMITPGGESAFVRRMVEESVSYNVQCGWYTSMLGKMSTLHDIIKTLREKKIDNYAVTELIQGQTRRWAIAWSFTNIRLPDTIARVCGPSLQSLMPPRNTLMHSCRSSISLKELSDTVREILAFMNGVSIYDCDAVTGESEQCLLIHASTNTWSRAARRRKLVAQAEIAAKHEETVAPQLMCRIDLAEGQSTDHSRQKVTQIIYHWVKGHDRGLFESFVSHVSRKVVSSLAVAETERMSIG